MFSLVWVMPPRVMARSAGSGLLLNHRGGTGGRVGRGGRGRRPREGAGHAAYTDMFHELARLVPHFVTLESRMIERLIKKVEKRGNVGEPSKDKNGRDDNKRTKTRNAFATTVNRVRRENTGTWPKCTTCNSYHAPGGPCRICFNCNRPSHLARDCR
ncbi:reverse transcriptase domain-containing protein, partial [Tanacetum coccineum]